MIPTSPISKPLPTCATCTHLRGRRYDPHESRKWQCFKSSQTIDIISGLTNYENCYDLRFSTHGCDLEGKWYEEYVPPVRELPEPKIGGVAATELTTEVVFDAEALAANKSAAEARLADIRSKRKTL